MRSARSRSSRCPSRPRSAPPIGHLAAAGILVGLIAVVGLLTPPRAARAGGRGKTDSGSGVASAPSPALPSTVAPESLRQRDRLLGDPGGSRTRLERLGVQLQLFYHQHLSGKASGGGASSASAFGHSGSYDFFARMDLDALVGWSGGRVLLHVRGLYDRNVNADVGAIGDPIDDADFDEPIFVDQLWLQQSLLDERLRLRIGLVEQQTLFDRNAYANSEDRQFLNAALDNDLLVPLPGGLSAAVILAPVPWAEVAAGTSDADNVPRDVGFGTAFDGIESLSWYVEASFASPFQRWERTGRYRFGVFIDGRERTEFRSAQESRGHVGAYLSFDQLVWQSRHDRRRQLGAFARAAYADRDVSPAAWSWSFGLEQTGLLRWRPRDVLGLGVYQLIGSSVYRSEVDPDFDRETGVEVYYAARVLGWLVVTPDVQVIVDPGATGGVGTAVIGTLRTRVTF